EAEHNDHPTKKQDPLTIELAINNSFGDYYFIHYVCTHEWKKRSRGTESKIRLRPLQSFRSTMCAATIQASVQRVVEDDFQPRFYVLVTTQRTQHNHAVNVRVFIGYAENRKVKGPSILGQVSEFVRWKTKFQRIAQYVRESSRIQCIGCTVTENVIMKARDQQRRSQYDSEHQSRNKEGSAERACAIIS
ncbi:TPA: hypothetical protein N0F65_011034, partial [Lagenidium giganteum]